MNKASDLDTNDVIQAAAYHLAEMWHRGDDGRSYVHDRLMAMNVADALRTVIVMAMWVGHADLTWIALRITDAHPTTAPDVVALAQRELDERAAAQDGDVN